jgi:hypothetical protein
VSFSPNSSIFTFGDAPLPEFDPSFFVLPPKDDARTLVARYFEFAVATHRFLHRPTVESWLEEFYEGLGVCCPQFLSLISMSREIRIMQFLSKLQCSTSPATYRFDSLQLLHV